MAIVAEGGTARMINLDLTRPEAEALSGALGTVENVNEHLTGAEESADAKLTAALAGQPLPEPAADRFPGPAPGAYSWAGAYPGLSVETAGQITCEILVEAGFMRAAIECADNVAGVTVLDALLAFHGNCWDDQHEGGAHRQDLIDVNRLFGWLSRPDLQDDFDEVHALVGDDTPDEERWQARS